VFLVVFVGLYNTNICVFRHISATKMSQVIFKSHLGSQFANFPFINLFKMLDFSFG
jgi:hypothetical protein